VSVINWDDAPSWANWTAQDDDGEWWWYEFEPETDDSGFYSSEGMEDKSKNQSEFIPEWKTTCEKRPSQWTSERERLQNKPSWNESPEWAEWLAQDYDGLWVFYENPVETSHNEWLVQDGFYGKIVRREKGEVLGDWRDTLERRPEFITPPTHENMRCIVNPIERKEWRGPEDGLPPVGNNVEYYDSVQKNWTKRWIVAHHVNGEEAIFSRSIDGGELFYGTPDDFRPLRTEEDKSVDEMLLLDPYDMNSGVGMMSRQDFCRKLYAAGYRKQEESK
jgi:hypothetical protein